MSSAVFAANVALLDTIRPSLGGRVERTPSEVSPETPAARSGGNTVVLSVPGAPRIQVHSAYDPVREAHRIAQGIPDSGTVVILGIGGGTVPRALLRTRPGASLILCEASLSSLKAACHAGDLRELLSSPDVHVAVGPAEVVGTLNMVHLDILRPGVATWELRPWTTAAPWADAFAACRSAVDGFERDARLDRATMERLGRLWAFAPLRTLVHMDRRREDSVPRVRSLIEGKRVGLAAAGPSLERSVGTVAACETVIAVDTALPVLRAHGVEPDVVVTVDAQPWSYLHLRRPLGERQVLVADASAPLAMLRRARHVVLGLGRHPFAQLLASAPIRHVPLDTDARNVAGTAFELARTLGARDIATGGDDFRYRLGRAYARGTYLDGVAEAAASRTGPVESFWEEFILERSSHTIRETDGFTALDPVLERYGEDMARRKASFASANGTDVDQRTTVEAGEFRPVAEVLRIHRRGVRTALTDWRTVSADATASARAMASALGPHGMAHLPFAYSLRAYGHRDPIGEALAQAGAFIDRIFQRYYSPYE